MSLMRRTGTTSQTPVSRGAAFVRIVNAVYAWEGKSSSCSTTTTYSYSIENKDQADIRDSKTQKEYLFWYGISIWYKA